jgi:hypothetical protein
MIFVTGLHDKPQGCGASVASAAGPSALANKSCGYTDCVTMAQLIK